MQTAREISRDTAPPQDHALPAPHTPALCLKDKDADPVWPSRIQQEWVQAILSESADTAPPILSRLKPGHCFDVYQQAYPSRLAEALAQTYPKTLLYMGSDLFDVHARRHAMQSPPQVMNLNEYGEDFAATLAQAYPDHPELVELVTLEWHLHAVYVAPNTTPLRQSDLASDTELSWLKHPRPMPAHARIMTVTRSVTQIWNAIDRDVDVPAVESLAEPTDLLIWRKGQQPHFVSLSALEAILIRHLLDGHSISNACELASEALATSEPDFLPSCLSRWLSLELLVAPTMHRTPG
ncbi:MAG: DNA-binding domain-containing protein [Alphaproteobacteria bacterium]|nr:DNA-binding domain-containing protein [Alphaproteobacteria bacterium]